MYANHDHMITLYRSTMYVSVVKCFSFEGFKMPSFIRISLVITLAILVNFVNGNQRIVHVSNLTSDEVSNSTCCVHGNCSCSSRGVGAKLEVVRQTFSLLAIL